MHELKKTKPHCVMQKCGRGSCKNAGYCFGNTHWSKCFLVWEAEIPKNLDTQNNIIHCAADQLMRRSSGLLKGAIVELTL